MNTKAVIFDLYGTLIDLFSWEESHEVLSDVAKTLALPIKPFQKLWTDTYPELVTGVYPDDKSCLLELCRRLEVLPCEADLNAAIVIKNEFTRRLMVPRPDAEETLMRLKAAGLKLALLTNSSSEVPRYWNQTVLAPLMDAAIFSFEAKVKKHDPKVYHLTCDRLGVLPKECIFVGDGGNRELEGAEAVGMTSVMIRTPEDHLYNPRRTASDNWAGLRISRLSEIVEISATR